MAEKRQVRAQRGDLLVTDDDGESWGPVACGNHTPDPETGASLAGPVGHQPSCAGCVQTAGLTLEHFNAAQRGRGHTVRG